jgi:hypothetical protein
MKRVLLTIGVLFTSQSFAAAPVFCSSPTMAYQSGCTSTCAAIAAAGSYELAAGSYATCEGKITKKMVDVRKIELGKTEIGNESRCTIWEGDDLQFDLSGNNGDFSSKYPIVLSKCVVGTTYDALYAVVGKYEEITGESVFPDGTGKKMRTTSTFGAKDTGHDNTTANWLDSGPALDSGFDDTSKYYTYPPGWSGWAYKKLGTKASDTDLSSASNEVMYWDEYKTSHSGNTDTTTRPGYNCSPSDSNECYASVSGHDDQYAGVIPSSNIQGLPITLKESDETLDLEWVRFSPVRGVNQYKGLEVLWHNDSGTLKYVGIGSSSDGGYLEISNVRSNEGL